jgi:SAM-dependent methyltransferase
VTAANQPATLRTALDAMDNPVVNEEAAAPFVRPSRPMEPALQRQLLALNARFYQTVGSAFDESRAGLPAGLRALIAHLPPAEAPGPLRLLDVGCGNGRLARAVDEAGIPCAYLGLDHDAGLLAAAALRDAGLATVTCRFGQIDLADPQWVHAALPPADAPSRFDAVVCLAVLHHLPGYALRLRVVREMAALLRPGGRLLFSTWQFLASQRLSRRLVAWQAIGVDPAGVEPGDALLPWTQGGYALRYCHQLDSAEVAALAADAGLAVLTTYRADGKEGNLNLYAVCEPLSI